MPSISRSAAFLAVAAVVTSSHAAPASAAGLEITACRDPARIVLANERLRVAQQRGTSFLFACSAAYRDGVYVGALTDRRPGSRGMFNLQAAGDYLAYQVQGEGCSRGFCVGPVAYVHDMGHRSAWRRFLGAVDLALRSDGAVATIERIDQASGDPAGDTAGPGPFRVVVTTGTSRTLLDAGADIDPASLAWRGTRLYWMRSGQPQTALPASEGTRIGSLPADDESDDEDVFGDGDDERVGPIDESAHDDGACYDDRGNDVPCPPLPVIAASASRVRAAGIDDPCRASARAVAANERIKVVQVRSADRLFGCGPAYRRGLYLGALTARRSRRERIFNLQVAGDHLAYQRRDRTGPVAYVRDIGRRSAPRRLPGAVDVVLRSDGAVATAERAGGRLRVAVTTGRARTVLDEASGIEASSLAWRDSRLYWLRAGQPQTALVD